MSDELNKSAEFVGKHQDEENPILIAQRYLNIFRQIHIFNKKRQDEFDDSLLKMPSDIRILLSTLPGGSLLLEHISELEEKRGIIPDALLDSKIASDKDISADERVSSSFKSTSKNTDNGALSNHLIKILQQSEEKHAKDLQALTNAFLKSQENMTDILKQAFNIKPSKESSSKDKDKDKAKKVVKTKAPEDEKHVAQPKEDTAEKAASNKQHTDNETSTPETTSKFLSFTKKLFTGHKAEDNASEEKEDVSPLIDNTPVSLDEIDSAPVSLDTPEAKPVSLDAPLPEEKSADDSQSSDDDWEWEYVNEDEPENPTDDEEWEYVEEDENASPDNEQWEYVEEDENAPANSEQWEYVEDNENTPSDTGAYVEDTQNILSEDAPYIDENADAVADNQNWQYIDENTNTFTDDENWEYNTDPNADYADAYPTDDNEQWAYVEGQDVQEDASDEQPNSSVQE